jgi:hypothetical protein
MKSILLEQFSNGFSRERDVECGDLSPLSVIAAKKRRLVAALQKLHANEIRSNLPISFEWSKRLEKAMQSNPENADMVKQLVADRETVTEKLRASGRIQ